MGSSVPESAATSQIDIQKRRSTRIAQAVPLTVTGVDALGRPFQERTSTLVINCHGCRYQSKHYILKNMWVTLEIPHPETGQEPRGARGKIMWIQRPRTVRELFQIGVELEVPGNVWGIAFPPEDWFPVTEIRVPELPSFAAQAETETPSEEEVLPGAADTDGNVRVLPGPGAETSLALARQLARLMVEAKQQIQTAAREATNKAVAAEVRPMLTAIQSQLSEAAERSLHDAAASYTDQVLRQALARIDEARQEADHAAREEWSREVERYVEEAQKQLGAQLAQAGETQRATFEQQLGAHHSLMLENLKNVGGQIVAGVDSAEARIQRFQRQLEESLEAAQRRLQKIAEGRVEGTRVHLEKLEQAARRVHNEITEAANEAQAGWRGRLDVDLAAAGTRWAEKIETSLEGAAQLAAERLARHSQDVAAQLEQELGSRAEAYRQSLQQAGAAAEATLKALCKALDVETARATAALAENQQAARRMEEHTARLDALSRATAEELQRRFERILEAESSELGRRAESAVAGVAERLQPALEASGQQLVARLTAQLEQQMASHLEGANELLRKLAAGRERNEERLRAHRERLAQASEKSLESAAARLQASLDLLERNFQERGRAATSQWLTELEEKATSTEHTTYEALYRASQWYEKKVQTQLQATLDKGLEQAANNLREKAGEISGRFTSELDHCSRNYVEHTRGQIEEAAREAVEGARGRVAQAMETTAATFSDDVHRVAQREFERLNDSAAATFEQTAAQLEAHAVQIRTQTEGEGRKFFVEFHKGMTQEIQQGVVQARQELEAQLAAVKEAWGTAREAQERQLQDAFARLSEESLDAYKKRLENASNSWLVATVTKLTRESEEAIATLASSTEQRLRETCSQVFAELGEALRQRLQGLSTFSPPGSSPQEKK